MATSRGQEQCRYGYIIVNSAGIGILGAVSVDLAMAVVMAVYGVAAVSRRQYQDEDYSEIACGGNYINAGVRALMYDSISNRCTVVLSSALPVHGMRAISMPRACQMLIDYGPEYAVSWLWSAGIRWTVVSGYGAVTAGCRPSMSDWSLLRFYVDTACGCLWCRCCQTGRIHWPPIRRHCISIWRR